MIYEFGNCKLDAERVEFWSDGAPVAMEPQVFSLLEFLIENRDRVVSKDEIIDAVWHGRAISDATLNTRINAARRAVGDNGKDQAVIRTHPRRGFRFVAELSEDGSSTEDGVNYLDGTQDIRFCTTDDGVQIAYSAVGAGPPIVKAANWLNHLEHDWQSPVWRHVFRELATDHTLVRYDARGNGLSDWNVEDFSFDAFVEDLESVIDALHLEKVTLLGMSQGCSVSIAYAARHPDRVERLILYGGFAAGWRVETTGGDAERQKALMSLIASGWGKDTPAFRQMFTSLFIPEGTPEQVQWFNELQRLTTSPENALRLRQTLADIDVRHRLPEIDKPTLVIHSRGDAMVPFEKGRKMAGAIPGAQFVALEGVNHLILEQDPAWPRFVAEIRQFLAGTGAG